MCVADGQCVVYGGWVRASPDSYMLAALNAVGSWDLEDAKTIYSSLLSEYEYWVEDSWVGGWMGG